NTFAYVKSNPLTRVDPLGLFCGNACDDLEFDNSPSTENITLPDGSVCDMLGSCFSQTQIEKFQAEECGESYYCTTVTRYISGAADAATIYAGLSVPSTGGASTPVAATVGLVATVVSAGNGLITVMFCGPSPSSVTTAVGAFVNTGKTAAAIGAVDLLLNASGM
ncbi:hypothetical protein, partial [Zooshikella harenae]